MARRDLGLSEEIAFLDMIKSLPNQSRRRLSELRGISQPSVLRMIYGEQKLRKLRASNNRGDVKRPRESKRPEVDRTKGGRALGDEAKREREELEFRNEIFSEEMTTGRKIFVKNRSNVRRKALHVGQTQRMS